MHRDDRLIFEGYIDGVTRTKNALGGHIMSIVKYGIPTKREFIKIRQELHDKTKEIEARGSITEEEREWAREIIAKIRNYRSQHPDDPPPYNQEENAEDMSKSPFHYDPMTHLADAAHQIYKILKNNSDDEARPEHIEKMAEIILGPQSEYASVDHYKRALSGIIELLNHHIVVSMNEGEEMPTSVFNKLKQHINKGPIKVNKASKELPYTHKYIHHLAKKDSREEHKEEDAEGGVTSKVEQGKTILWGILNNYLESAYRGPFPEENIPYEEIANKIKSKILSTNYLTRDDLIAAIEEWNEGAEESNGEWQPLDMEDLMNALGLEENAEDEERRLDPKCWSGYHKQGTKLKDGVRVNNCVKNEQEEDSYSGVAHNYAERIVGADTDDPKALAKHYLDNPEDVPEPLQHEILKQNFEKILKYIDFTVRLNQRRKKEEEYKKRELERGPVEPDPEIDLPGSKQARYKPHYRYNPADYLPRQ